MRLAVGTYRGSNSARIRKPHAAQKFQQQHNHHHHRRPCKPAADQTSPHNRHVTRSRRRQGRTRRRPRWSPQRVLGHGRGTRRAPLGPLSGQSHPSWDHLRPVANKEQPYTIPESRSLTITEKNSVKHFLLLRHQLHSSPLYTSKTSIDPTKPRKAYGMAQTNALYGVRNKASQDPFTAMPTYGQRFVREERSLPDWSKRPISRELWPQELLDAVDPEDEGGNRKKKRKLELTRVSALPNAEEAFGLADPYADEDGGKNLLERLNAMEELEGEGVEGEEEEGAQEEEEQDEVYDDEDAGDYDAENYFDNGDEMGEDLGDDGDGEGTF